MNWEAKIEKGENGFILRINNIETEYPAERVIVFQFDENKPDDSKENREVVADMLWALVEYFDEGGNKYSRYRVKIDVRKECDE